jgi:indolepyruvate decarboxylase
MLGTVLTDVNLGIFTADLDHGRAIEATSELVSISRHRYDRVDFVQFVRTLGRAKLRRRASRRKAPAPRPVVGEPRDVAMTVTRLFDFIDQRLSKDMAVVCDVGLCLFGAIDLVIHRKTEFIAPAYYTSMGFAVPASIGVALANPKLRPVVLVGDGAFQMTGMELSTIVAQGLDPIVIVLNNHGYTTERFIKDGSYNDILNWRYDRIPEILGHGWGRQVCSEREFVDAWDIACAYRGRFSLISVELDPFDHCPALGRLGERMARNLAQPG